MAREKTGVRGGPKGQRAQVDVKDKVRDWLNLPESEFVTAPRGKKAADVGFSLRARELFPYHCEIKHHATAAYESWIAQAMRDSPLVSGGAEPIVIFKENRKIYVFTRIEEFFRLTQQAGILDYNLLFPEFVEAQLTKTIGLWIRVPFNTFMELATVKMAEGEAA